MRFFKEKPQKAVFLTGLIFVLLLTFGALATLYFYKDTGLDSNVLAIVGSEKITKDDLNKAIYGRNFQGTPQNPKENLTDQEKSEVLDGLIESKIIQLAAKEDGLGASDAEIKSLIAINLE